MRNSNVQFQHHLSALAEALGLCAWLVHECFIKAHHSQLVHVQDEKAIICTPVSALDLTQEFYWSFLRHLARSSLFPSYAGGGVPLGFVMVALSAHCFLRYCAMPHTPLSIFKGQAAVHGQPGCCGAAPLPEVPLSLAGKLNCFTTSLGPLRSICPSYLLGQSVFSSLFGCSASMVMAVSTICLTRLLMGTALIAMSSLPSSNPGQSDAHTEP